MSLKKHLVVKSLGWGLWGFSVLGVLLFGLGQVRVGGFSPFLDRVFWVVPGWALWLTAGILGGIFLFVGQVMRAPKAQQEFSVMANVREIQAQVERHERRQAAISSKPWGTQWFFRFCLSVLGWWQGIEGKRRLLALNLDLCEENRVHTPLHDPEEERMVPPLGPLPKEGETVPLLFEDVESSVILSSKPPLPNPLPSMVEGVQAWCLALAKAAHGNIKATLQRSEDLSQRINQDRLILRALYECIRRLRFRREEQAALMQAFESFKRSLLAAYHTDRVPQVLVEEFTAAFQEVQSDLAVIEALIKAYGEVENLGEVHVKQQTFLSKTDRAWMEEQMARGDWELSLEQQAQARRFFTGLDALNRKIEEVRAGQAKQQEEMDHLEQSCEVFKTDLEKWAKVREETMARLFEGQAALAAVLGEHLELLSQYNRHLQEMNQILGEGIGRTDRGIAEVKAGQEANRAALEKIRRQLEENQRILDGGDSGVSMKERMDANLACSQRQLKESEAIEEKARQAEQKAARAESKAATAESKAATAEAEAAKANRELAVQSEKIQTMLTAFAQLQEQVGRRDEELAKQQEQQLKASVVLSKPVIPYLNQAFDSAVASGVIGSSGMKGPCREGESMPLYQRPLK